MEPRSPALQVDSLLAEPPGKPRNNTCTNSSIKTCWVKKWMVGVIEYYLTLDVLGVPALDAGTIFFPLPLSSSSLAIVRAFSWTLAPHAAQNAGAAAAFCALIPSQSSSSASGLACCVSLLRFLVLHLHSVSLCCLFPIPRLYNLNRPQKDSVSLRKPTSSLCYWLISPVTFFSLYSLPRGNAYCHEKILF